MIEPPAPHDGPAGAHLSPEHPLDRAVAETLGVRARWVLAGLVAALGTVVTGLVLAAVIALFGLPLDHDVDEAYGLVAAGVTGGAVWLAGRRVATRYGGWGPAFGFTMPAQGEGGQIVRWSVLQVLVRFLLAVLVAPLLPKGAHGGNLEGVSHLSSSALVMLGLGAVLVAPVLEELMFRGILLRGLMRRLAFWPAAVASSLVFAVLHLGGISDWSATVPALAFTSVFGLLQCELVRRTARLGPAMGVHAVTNLFFVALALLAGT